MIIGSTGSTMSGQTRGRGVAWTRTSQVTARSEEPRYERNNGRSSSDASSKRSGVVKRERSGPDTGHLAVWFPKEVSDPVLAHVATTVPAVVHGTSRLRLLFAPSDLAKSRSASFPTHRARGSDDSDSLGDLDRRGLERRLRLPTDVAPNSRPS